MVLRRVLGVAALLVGVALATGCEERRYVEPAVAPGAVAPGAVAPGTEIVPAAPGVDVDVRTPAGRVKVDGAAPLAPHRDVKVDVGNGGVQVNVDGEPLLERLRERRDERNAVPVPAVP